MDWFAVLRAWTFAFCLLLFLPPSESLSDMIQITLSLLSERIYFNIILRSFSDQL